MTGCNVGETAHPPGCVCDDGRFPDESPVEVHYPPLSQRAMAGRFGLSRRRVSQLITQVTASGNGHRPEGEAA